MSNYIPKYPDRGKSYIAFPTSYCVVDLETTGLSPDWDDIIEIGAIKFLHGEEVDRFQTLVNRPYIPAFITELTGITLGMLKDAPRIDAVLPAFLSFLGDLPIICYNVSFDINFIYAACIQVSGKPFTNNFIDTMRIARKMHPEMAHHRLQDMVSLFGFSSEGAHRALADCEATHHCYLQLKEEALTAYGTEEAFTDRFKRRYANRLSLGVKASDIQADPSKFDEDSPIYQKHCVFTGKLERYTRKEAMQIVANLGGINGDNVTKNTNFLILGNNDYCTTIQGGKSSKHKKAEKYKIEGLDIEIIPEDVFYRMLEDD